MRTKFSKPIGPWKTIRATYQDRDIALIRKQPHAGYQVIVSTMMFEGKFGKTNTKFFTSIKDAKNFVEDTVIDLVIGQ